MGAATTYHQATKHSPTSVRASHHQLDWSNQPLPYKTYTSIEPLALPRDAGAADTGRIDRATLARLCLYSNGIMRVLHRHGTATPFRAAACTGALFHIEEYLVCGDLPDAQLEAGVYHYDVQHHALRRLRGGDFRAVLADATGAEPSVGTAPLTLVCTSTFWRNAWKYQARAYRHSFWDTGTVLANLFEVAAAHGIRHRLVLGFADHAVNRLLDVDPAREAAIALVSLGSGAAPLDDAPSFGPLHLPTRRLSASQVDYPAIAAIHAASSLASGAQAAAWRVPMEAEPRSSGGLEDVEGVIRRRGSSRQFSQAPIDFEQLHTLLRFATRPIPSDVGGFGPLTTPFLILNAVDGLEPGSYRFDRARSQLVPLQHGALRDVAGYLDLGQPLAADAAVNVYSLTELDRVLDRFGERGYRAAQLEAAIEGGRLYLSAYAQRLGATGLTFYDDEVVRFFGQGSATTGAMFLTAIGRPVSRSTA